MTQLIDAIIAAFKADTAGPTALMTLTTGIKQGPAYTADFDFVTLSATGGGSNPTYGDHPTAQVDVTFSIWCNGGPTKAAAISNAVIAKFKNLLPTLATGKVLNVYLLQPPLYMPQRDKDEQQNTVTMIAVMFRYSVEMW